MLAGAAMEALFNWVWRALRKQCLTPTGAIHNGCLRAEDLIPYGSYLDLFYGHTTRQTAENEEVEQVHLILYTCVLKHTKLNLYWGASSRLDQSVVGKGDLRTPDDFLPNCIMSAGWGPRAVLATALPDAIGQAWGRGLITGQLPSRPSTLPWGQMSVSLSCPPTLDPSSASLSLISACGHHRRVIFKWNATDTYERQIS